MIPLPWTIRSAAPDPAASCTVVAARLPLRSRRALPRALADAVRVHRRLAHEDAVLGHALATEVAVAAVWTVSAWADRAALARFERSPTHRAVVHRLRRQLRPSTLVVWRCLARDLPVRWDEVRRRVRCAERRTEAHPNR